jgi:DNA-directed RNA polymerase specialized sigma24 family protein
MFGNEKLKTPNLHADYAQLVDFCEVFERDMKPLYLLAFLLTASHQAAERCFASTVEEALKSQAIFKEWRRSWVKRSLIKNAIQIVSPASGRATQKRDLWSAQHRGKPGDVEIDAVTRLAPLERFIFVMSILERHSVRECSLLLGCDMNTVVQLRMRALPGLPRPDALLPRGEAMLSRSLQVPARLG